MFCIALENDNKSSRHSKQFPPEVTLKLASLCISLNPKMNKTFTVKQLTKYFDSNEYV